jgi:beta-glucanase (GH16 family)
MLSLTAKDQTAHGITMTTGAPRTYQYTSGMVDTYKKFSFQYGYVEWRAELPTGQGFWPALWLMPENNSWPPEIDALEVVGNQPDIGNYTYHPPSPQPSQGFDTKISGLSSGWHTFGVDWEPGRITWYVDGNQVAKTTYDVTSLPMYLVMNLAVGGAWPGYPDASTPFPSSLNIDYVRVWQEA